MATFHTQYDSGIMARPGHVRLNLDLFYDYRKNAELHPVWEKFLHDHQPKTIIFWGQHDPFFTPEGGEAYLRDLPKAEMYRLNAGHFAAKDNAPFIAARNFGANAGCVNQEALASAAGPNRRATFADWGGSIGSACIIANLVMWMRHTRPYSIAGAGYP